MPRFEFKPRSAIRTLLAACLFSVPLIQPAQAELAPQGSYLQTSPHPSMATPPGIYRTRLAWLMASQIAFQNQSAFERGWFNAAMVPGLYKNALQREQAYYAGLKGLAHFNYADALLRDVVQMQILTLQNSQMSIALDTVPVAIFADVASTVISAGISEVLPKARQGILALDSRFLEAGTEQNLIARYAFIDMELRYRDFMDSAVFRAWKDQMASGVSAADLTGLMSESVLSTAIGTAVNAYRGTPEQLLEMFRTQLVMEVAAYNCACVLDINTHRIAGATEALLSSNGNYRTGLGWVLAQKLAPPSTGLLSWSAMLGSTNNSLTTELANIRSWKANKPTRYGTYMRSLLVDLETLERAQIAALQSGTTMAFIESTVLNVLFGAFSLGGGIGAQAVAILANAGYGAMDTYYTVGEELKIRMQMAALREQVLDNIRPFAEQCGCGAGVVVVPRTAIIGDTPGNP